MNICDLNVCQLSTARGFTINYKYDVHMLIAVQAYVLCYDNATTANKPQQLLKHTYKQENK